MAKIEPVTVTIKVDPTPMRLLRDKIEISKMRQHLCARGERIEAMRLMRGADLMDAFETFEKDTSHMLFRGGYLSGINDAMKAALSPNFSRPRLCL